MPHKVRRIAVLGGGSFGTALASLAADNQLTVRQWVRCEQQAQEINTKHTNLHYLADFEINQNVQASTDFSFVLEQASLVLVAIPSKYFRQIIKQASLWINAGTIVVSTAKGIEAQGFKLMSRVLAEETISQHIGVLSGPNLAPEIAQHQLTASVIASDDVFTCHVVQQALSNEYFRIYTSNDRYGVELGGALKNIYAIAVGMAHALGMGENTKSMLITRALAEMSRFAVSQGANPLTFLGLAGVGDLVVTCSSTLSRNFRIGLAVGQGQSLEQATAALGQVAEGINTVRLVYAKAKKDNIYMPIVSGLYQVLFEQMAPIAIAKMLMQGDFASDVEFTLPHAAI